MAEPILILVLAAVPILSFLPSSSSITYLSLTKGSSLSSQDVLLSSPNAVFTSGFFPVGENAYCFAIWFSKAYDGGNLTVVWMANRDQPVNGRHSKLSLEKSGDLVLTDAGQLSVWRSGIKSNSSVQLQLLDNGNLALSSPAGTILWQSFDSPTTTLLPQQPFTRKTMLVSSRSRTNHSTGFYKLYFADDNVLRLRYEGPEITSVYWPDPWLNSWEAGRSSYNNSNIAVLDSWGHFYSSDHLKFNTVDYGVGPQRRLILDVDGVVRVYSLNKVNKSWDVTWQSSQQSCWIHGICGSNSLCSYHRQSGRRCSCLPGYRMRNQSDWSYGCKKSFKLSCKSTVSVGFLQLRNTEFYGYDSGYFENYTLRQCEEECLKHCACKGFQYKFDKEKGYYSCYPKTLLFNGYRSLGFNDPMYVKLPFSILASLKEKPVEEFNLQYLAHVTSLDRPYQKKNQFLWFRSFIWSTCVVGAIELLFLLAFLYKTRKRSNATIEGHFQVATGFRRYTYTELKKATKNFTEEIGRGGGGVVYKGMLSDNLLTAIKCLTEANQGEAEFHAELSIIGRLNRMNLIETWGYCAEGKHRLLVHEFMEHGSLAENLYSNKLDWKKRYDIALGTAKGLAYLHEECLEWVLHCDVKPQNILLDSNYQPKVADFGLSKLLNRGVKENSSFSKIRGTRGYMAPEWVFNLPITSKVDVYSYGIVLLELITGRSPTGSTSNTSGGLEQGRLVTWVKEKMHGIHGRAAESVMEIVDSALIGEFDMNSMVNLVKVALSCAEEDKDARPTMSQVVDMLLVQESDD